MPNELDEAALSAIEAPERIWLTEFLDGQEPRFLMANWRTPTTRNTDGGDYVATRLHQKVAYVRADTVEALRAELAEKEKEIDQVSNLAGEWELRYDDMCREAAALRANQATVVQDAFKFLEDANETFHVKWSFLTKRYLITIPNLDQEFSGKTLTEAIEAARHTEDEAAEVHACGDPDCIVPHPAPHKKPPQQKKE